MAAITQATAGTTATRDETTTEVWATTTVGVPAAHLYQFWRDLGNLPRFMRRILSVTPLGDGGSHWVARDKDGNRVEWDARLIDDRPGELIAWESAPDAAVTHVGRVRFEPATGGRGTVVRLHLRLSPAFAVPTRAGLARLLSRSSIGDPADEDLRHFRQLIETGEIPTTEGQPHGRRSALGKRLSASS